MRYLTKFSAFILTMALSACQTVPFEKFQSLKVGMTKDDVLESVGSPNRSEYFEGKEKWAYRFYTGPEKNIIDLRQVTFLNGNIISFGADIEEINRLSAIEAEDKARSERRKAFKLPAVSGEQKPLVLVHPAENVATEIETQKSPQESDWVELKGKRGPINETPHEGDSHGDH